jgi:Fic family protein
MFAPDFTLTPLLQRQLLTIERTRGFLEAVRLQPDWAARTRHQVTVEDALASVQVEGNSLTREAAFALAQETPDRALRDSEREFLNMLRAFKTIEDLKGERDYTVRARDLRGIQSILVDGVRGGRRHAGRFRQEEVTVGDRVDGEIIVHHQPPDWTRVEDEVTALLDWNERAKQKPSSAAAHRGKPDSWIHPILIAGIAQHRLVWIHPFVDGNGRSARMFSTLLLHQRGYDFQYLFNLSDYYNRNRDKYYSALRTADVTGDYTKWLEYFCGGFSLQMFLIRKQAAANAAAVAAIPD